MLCLPWPNLARSCRQTFLTWPPCASHGFLARPIWINLGPTSAQPDQLAPSWPQVGSNLGQGPDSGHFADSMRYAETCVFAHLHSNFPKLRHFTPQLGPQLEPTGPSLVQVSLKLGPSWLVFGPAKFDSRQLLSSLSYSLGAGGTRGEATRIHQMRQARLRSCININSARVRQNQLCVKTQLRLLAVMLSYCRHG